MSFFEKLFFICKQTKENEPEITSELTDINKENTINLSIRTFTGKTIYIQINPSDTIEEVKEKIFFLEGIPTNRQRLLFASEELEDDRTLADYNIQLSNLL